MLSAPMRGYVLGVLSACLSAMAGVYTEFLLKKNNDNLYWQNVQLYGFGFLFNAVRLTYDDVNASLERVLDAERIPRIQPRDVAHRH